MRALILILVLFPKQLDPATQPHLRAQCVALAPDRSAFVPCDDFVIILRNI